MFDLFGSLFGSKKKEASQPPVPSGPQFDDLFQPRQNTAVSPFTGQGSSAFGNKDFAGTQRVEKVKSIQQEFPMSIDPNVGDHELDRLLDEANQKSAKRQARLHLRGNIDQDILDNGSDEEVAMAVEADYNRLLQNYPKDAPEVPNWIEDPLRTGFGFLEGGAAAIGDTITGASQLAFGHNKATEPVLDRQYINRYREYLQEHDPETYVTVRGNESLIGIYPEKSLIGGAVAESLAEGYLVGSTMYKAVNAIPAVQHLSTMGRGGRIMQYALQNIAVDVGIRTDMAVKNRQGVDDIVRGVASSPSILFGFSSVPAIGIGVVADLLVGKSLGLSTQENLTNAAVNFGGNLVDFRGLRKDLAASTLKTMRDSFVNAFGGDKRMAEAAFDEAQNLNAYARMHPDDVRGVQRMFMESENRLLTLKKTLESGTVTGKESRLAGLTGPQGGDVPPFVPPKKANMDDLIKKYGSEDAIPLSEIDNVEAARVAAAQGLGADEMAYGLPKTYKTDSLVDEAGWHNIKGPGSTQEIVLSDGTKVRAKNRQFFRAMSQADYEEALKTGYIKPSAPEPGQKAGRIYFTVYPDAAHTFARIYGKDQVMITGSFDDLPKMMGDPHTAGDIQLNAYTTDPIDIRSVKLISGGEGIVTAKGLNDDLGAVLGQTKGAAQPDLNLPAKGKQPQEFPDSFNDQKHMGFTGERGALPKEGGTHVRGRNLGDEITERIKKQNAQMPDQDIADFRTKQLLNEEGIDEIILRKRGILSNEEVTKRAASLKMTRESMLNLRQGETLNAEQAVAFRQQLQYERELAKKLRDMRDAFDSGSINTFSEAERATMQRALGFGEGVSMKDSELVNEAIMKQGMEMKKMEYIDYGIGSEAGRALQTRKMFTASVEPRMRSIFQKMKHLPKEKQDAVLKQLFETNLDNPQSYLKMVQQLDSPDFFDKYAEWITSKFLWNPTTHVVNFGGNATRQGVDLFTQTATSIAEGKPGRVMADFSGLINGVGAGGRRAMLALTNEGYAMSLSKFVEAGGTGPAIQGTKGEIVRLPFRLLTAADELFKGIASHRSIYRQAYDAAAASGLKGKELWAAVEESVRFPPPKFLEIAEGEAKRMTFQTELDEVAQWFSKARDPKAFKSTTGKVVASGVRTFIPFYKTPVNIFKQALDFSPVGFRHAFEDLPKTAKINRIVEATVGTAAMASVAYFVDKNYITGAAPTDPKELEQFYREGKVPYAIRVGDKWVSYKRVDPFATTIGLVADMMHKPDDANAFSYAWYVFTEQMRDKTFLQGVQDMLDLFNSGGDDSQWKVERVMKRLAPTVLLPSIVGHTARTVDPVIRKSKGTTFLEEFLKQIPFASKTVDPKIDVFGNTVERSRSGLNYFFSPIDTDTQNVLPLDAAMTEAGYLYPLPKDNFTINGHPVQMDGQEYVKFSRAMGKELYTKASAMIEWKEYKEATVEDKVKALKKIREKTLEAYKEAFVEWKIQQGDLDPSILKKKGNGLPSLPSVKGPKSPPQP